MPAAAAERVRAALRRRRYAAFVLGGGVSLNSRIRETLSEECRAAGVPMMTALPKYTGDNGAMVAGLAYLRRRVDGAAAMRMDAEPSLEVGDGNGKEAANG